MVLDRGMDGFNKCFSFNTKPEVLEKKSGAGAAPK